jgi:hypothetical protein
MPAPYSDAVPSGHAACTPGDTIKKPASGGAQKAELALDTTPIAQRVQEGAPAALYAPAAQLVHPQPPHWGGPVPVGYVPTAEWFKGLCGVKGWGLGACVYVRAWTLAFLGAGLRAKPTTGRAHLVPPRPWCVSPRRARQAARAVKGRAIGCVSSARAGALHAPGADEVAPVGWVAPIKSRVTSRACRARCAVCNGHPRASGNVGARGAITGRAHTTHVGTPRGWVAAVSPRVAVRTGGAGQAARRIQCAKCGVVARWAWALDVGYALVVSARNVGAGATASSSDKVGGAGEAVREGRSAGGAAREGVVFAGGAALACSGSGVPILARGANRRACVTGKEKKQHSGVGGVHYSCDNRKRSSVACNPTSVTVGRWLAGGRGLVVVPTA